MIANVGTTDRAFRLVLGAALKYGAVVVGIVMLATSTFRFCPLYTVLGIKTCRN